MRQPDRIPFVLLSIAIGVTVTLSGCAGAPSGGAPGGTSSDGSGSTGDCGQLQTQLGIGDEQTALGVTVAIPPGGSNCAIIVPNGLSDDWYAPIGYVDHPDTYNVSTIRVNDERQCSFTGKIERSDGITTFDNITCGPKYLDQVGTDGASGGDVTALGAWPTGVDVLPQVETTPTDPLNPGETLFLLSSPSIHPESVIGGWALSNLRDGDVYTSDSGDVTTATGSTNDGAYAVRLIMAVVPDGSTGSVSFVKQ